MGYIISFFLAAGAEGFAAWRYFEYHWEKKRNRTVTMMAYIIGYLFLFGLLFFRIYKFNLIGFIVVNFLILYLMYNIRFINALFNTAVLTAMMGLSEVIAGNVLNYLIPIHNGDEGSVMLLALFGLFSKPLYLFLVQIVCYISSKKNSRAAVDKKELISLVFACAVIVWCMFVYIEISLGTQLNRSFQIKVASCSMLLILMVVNIVRVYQYLQEKSRENTDILLLAQKNEDLLEYYKGMIAQEENRKIIIHDIKNHFNILEELGRNGEYDRLNSYLRQITSMPELTRDIKLSDNVLLNAIFNRYTEMCSTNNISFETDIRSSVMNGFQYDEITAMFSNLMDNAIRAASGGGYIRLRMYRNENTDSMVIVMSNSCNLEPGLNTNGEFVTIKEEQKKHGIGMKSVKKIVEKHDGNMRASYNTETKEFKVTIMCK